jgi:outer membrane protein assembly factor BamA
MEQMEEKSVNSEKIWKIQKKIVKRYGKYGRKASRIVIRYEKYGTKKVE